MHTLQQDDTRPTSARDGGHRRSRGVLVAVLGVAVVGAAALGALAGRALDLLPGWTDGVQQQVVDRSTPPLMTALEDLSEYHAATGSFQVVIDQERDTPLLPSVISGERTTFLATGSVDALVDLGGLDEDQVQVSEDRRTVSIALPAPTLGDVRVDPENTRVLDRDRGLLDRVGGAFAENPSSEAEFYVLAEDRLAEAAGESDLLRRAEDNTRAMLTALARSLGFEDVTVTFASTT